MEAINDIDGLMSTDLGNKDDLFAFKISYNTPEDTNKALFNGNISETYWRTLYDDQKRKYEYTYDHLNRLLQADYSRPDNKNIKNAYKEKLTYDKNGNITTLVRNSFEDESYEYEIDNLMYAYDANNKNQLATVTDNSGWTDGFNENKDPNGYSANDTTDYTYDANGNMVSDENKGISSITYNHLNLPVKIVFDNDLNFRIEYLYDATGKKVAKKVHTKETVYFPCQGGGGGGESFRSTSAAGVTQQCSSTSQVLEETDYLAGGFQYKFGQLEFFPHAEGFVKWDGSYAQYYFNYTDHLGNVRVTYYDDGRGTPVLWEESNYYPFGLKHKGYNEPEQYERYWGNGTVTNQSVNSNKYKYNGKELQDELGLNMYDYGARNYDPAIGRWMNIDPKAEAAQDWTPYRYCFNSPIRMLDPDGMLEDWYQNESTGDYEYWEGSGEKEGYKNLGESAQIVVNDSNGNNTGSVNLNKDGSADFIRGDSSVTVNNSTIDPGFASGNKIRTGDWGLSSNLTLGGTGGFYTLGASAFTATPFHKSLLKYTPEWFHGGYGRGWTKGTPFTSIGSFGSRRLGFGGDFGRALPGNLLKVGMYQLGGEALYDAMLINSDSEVLKRFDNNQRNNPYSGFVIEGNHFFRTDNKQNLLQQESTKTKQDALRRMNPALYDMGTSAGY